LDRRGPNLTELQQKAVDEPSSETAQIMACQERKYDLHLRSSHADPVQGFVKTFEHLDLRSCNDHAMLGKTIRSVACIQTITLRLYLQWKRRLKPGSVAPPMVRQAWFLDRFDPFHPDLTVAFDDTSDHPIRKLMKSYLCDLRNHRGCSIPWWRRAVVEWSSGRICPLAWSPYSACVSLAESWRGLCCHTGLGAHSSSWRSFSIDAVSQPCAASSPCGA